MNDSEQPAAQGTPISRRGFNRWFAFTGVLAALGAFVAYWRERKRSYPAKVIARVGEIPVGGSKVFAYPEEDRPCFLLRPAEDTYLAFSRLCTHHTCPVFYRPEENVFACPCHGGMFSATTGAVLGGPPPRPLPQVVLQRHRDEIVATGFVRSS